MDNELAGSGLQRRPLYYANTLPSTYLEVCSKLKILSLADPKCRPGASSVGPLVSAADFTCARHALSKGLSAA